MMASIIKNIPIEVAFDINVNDVKNALKAFSPQQTIEILDHITALMSDKGSNKYANDNYLLKVENCFKNSLQNIIQLRKEQNNEQ